MKKFTLILAFLLTLSFASLRADNEKVIPVNQFPTTAQQMIKQHFGDKKVAVSKVETDMLSKSYEVIFTDGDKVEFDGKGNWEEIDCRFSSVPAGIIPAPIMNYVKENYPDTIIKKIEKDRREYEVKLSNRVELSFDMEYNLTDIDM